MPYIVLRVRSCNIVLNVHVASEDKSDDSKDSFYEELEQVFDHFPKHHMKILLGKFDAKLGIQNILSLTNGNKSLPGDNGDKSGVVDFATSGCLWHNLPTMKHS